MFEIVMYENDKGCPVEEYISGLPESQQNKIFAYIDKLENEGHALRRPLADSLGHKTGLYELRPARHRILYAFFERSKIILLHAFLKRTDKIPQKEIEVALKRRDDYLSK